MAWTVSFDPRALAELEKLDRSVQRRIVSFLVERIQGTKDPRGTGKPLRGEQGGVWRYRVRDYRILGHLGDNAERVLVLRIGHRKSVYR
ncbi:MAG: type II toxin-antitoxin system RelE family toxin [Terriglobales bacterium]